MEYDELILVWKNERSNPSLCNIPKDLYISLDGLLTKLSADIQKLASKSIANAILDRIIFIRRDIVHLRLVKIVNLVINDIFFDENVLTWGERRIAKNLRLSIETIGVEKPNILDGLEDSPEIDQFENSTVVINPIQEIRGKKTTVFEYSTVRMLYDVEAFIGLDDLSYGPLEKNDIVNLPLENATALMVRGVARLIETQKD
ncbi:MAG: DNA replication complex subunit Gins51 [Candidatus Hodarchaeales archaeon]